MTTHRLITLPLGSIATDLSSPQQLFGVCLAQLTSLNQILAARHRAKSICQAAESGGDLSLVQRYQLSRANSALLADLNRFAPAFAYVGWHQTDKSHLGVWVDLEALHAAERDGSLTQVTGGTWFGTSPYVLDMSSGLTLYRRRGKVPVWSIS